jgi:hypothetical protein
MIESALVHASVDKVPDVAWISHLIASDMEEFIDSPFGEVTPLSVPKGPYSIHGYGMINNGIKHKKMTFENCLQQLVDKLWHDTHCSFLRVMGYCKQPNGSITSIVNGRPFDCTDAEHFLCKAWLNAKITFGNYRIIQYPKQCNSFTHPSPVLHRLNNEIVNKIMHEMEHEYLSLKDETDTEKLQLPDFCLLPGETHNGNNVI